jgi:hypothetical protein
MNASRLSQKATGVKPKRTSSVYTVFAVILLSLPAAAQPTTFTSPIDITGFQTQLRVVAPDPNTGSPINAALPTGLLPPKISVFFTTPLSGQIDQYWAVTPDAKTGKTPRDGACNGPTGIVHQIQTSVAKVGSGFSAADISCNLASTGKLLLQQNGSALTLAYLLTNNTVTFRATTPFTCAPGHGTAFCPTDPVFKVTFATELITTVDAPGLCGLTATNGTVVVQAVDIEGDSLTGKLAILTDSLFLGHKFPAAEQGIESSQNQVALPLDADFQQMRSSRACASGDPLHRILLTFRDFNVALVRSSLVFTMTHPPLLPPVVSVPNPSVVGPAPPSQPTFTRPMIATTRPSVPAGSSVEVTGQFFPPNPNRATSLPVTFTHPGFGGNSIVLGGPCFGGGTDLRFGPAASPQSTQRLLGAGQSTCPNSFNAINLTPATAFQFSARDCDAITCSLFSAPVRVTTATVDPNRGRLNLTLDAVTPIGSAILSDTGTFDINAAIPAGAAPGLHKIHSVSGTAVADADLTVTGAGATGKASLIMVGILTGETGCPNHPISSTVVASAFTLFGSGFTPGVVTVRLDALTGFGIGTATARPDGSFCQMMPGVPLNLAGSHKLLGIQSGVVESQTPITFVPPTVIH